MADCDKLLGNFQTIFVDVSEFQFETLEQKSGKATVIRFRIPEQVLLRGDILVVLDEGEILFHGAITRIDSSGAQASDLSRSILPAK